MRGSGAPCSVISNTGGVNGSLIFCSESGKEGAPLLLLTKKERLQRSVCLVKDEEHIMQLFMCMDFRRQRREPWSSAITVCFLSNCCVIPEHHINLSHNN